MADGPGVKLFNTVLKLTVSYPYLHRLANWSISSRGFIDYDIYNHFSNDILDTVTNQK